MLNVNLNFLLTHFSRRTAMTTLTIKNLSMTEALDREAMAAIRGGFWEIFGLQFKSMAEDQNGEECVNGICVPYQQEEGNY